MSIGNTAVARHDAAETIVGVGPATVIHDQHIFNSETRLVADLGVTDWLAAGLIVPFRVFDTSIRYLDESGHEVQIENPFIHHHNETLTGLADPWLIARAAHRLSGVTLGARLGTTIPLGRTVEDPFVLGDMGLPHEHTQFGTGTFEPVVGLDASRTFGSIHVDAFALTVQSLYTNGHGYRAGDRYAGGAGGAAALGSNRWRLRITGEVQHETAEMWHGLVRTDEGNTGRTDVLAGAELTWRVSDSWHLSATAKVPVYTHVQGGQLEVPVFFGVSIGTQVHVFDRADHAPLVPVPGKITVFDFWATWCVPCRTVDRELADIVRRHPADIAVRKIDVGDTDAPFPLPHLKVFGRDGKLLWERSAAPLALTGAVEQLVTGAPKPVPVAGARRIAIEVTDDGYHPARIEIEHGEPVTLVFTRTSTRTCATDVHFALPDGTRIDEQLPLGQAVEIPIRVAQPGEVVYACGMNMDHGTIVVK